MKPMNTMKMNTCRFSKMDGCVIPEFSRESNSSNSSLLSSGSPIFNTMKSRVLKSNYSLIKVLMRKSGCRLWKSMKFLNSFMKMSVSAWSWMS